MIVKKSEIKKLAICLCFLGMLNACIKKEEIKSPIFFSKSNISQSNCEPVKSDPLLEKKSIDSLITMQQVRQIEAKYADLPIPMDAVPIPTFCSCNAAGNEQLKLAYRCANTPEAIATFYNQRMEGWQEIGRFEGEEFLIHYQRPDKWCSVAIRRVTNKHDPNLIVYMASSKQIIS